MAEIDQIRRRLAFAGVLLFTLGMVTGFWLAAAVTKKFGIGDPVLTPQLARAAHLNALFGSLWLIAAAWSFQFLRYGARGLKRLAFIMALPAWANWLVTLVASIIGVNGLEYKGQLANDSIAFLLQTLVVLPTLIACAFWVWGFKRQ
jgi:(hydroxyamino)benzene mutase